MWTLPCRELNGLDAARQIKHSMPQVKLIFMTMNEDPDLVGEAFRAGGSGFLLKQAAAFELTAAIDKVVKGGSYVTPSAAEGQANIALREPRARQSCRGANTSTTGSDSTAGGGAFHEGSGFRFEHHETDGCGA